MVYMAYGPGRRTAHATRPVDWPPRNRQTIPRRWLGLVLGCLFLLLLLAAPNDLLANPEASWTGDGRTAGQRAEDMIIDGLICRPLGLVASVVGVAFYTVSLPFSLAGGNAGQAARELVVRPLQFTFTRPLGEPECKDPREYPRR
ncbi:MAG: hypothetical protein HQL65_10050 [Magnetococcales bacterium]|nr:hypothetical protein [Magnetococcales bacterium]